MPLPTFGFSMTKTLKDEIIEQVERLGGAQQRQVLDFARSLALPAPVRGRDLLRFAGSLPPADLAEITQAILEGCEKVERNACRRRANSRAPLIFLPPKHLPQSAPLLTFSLTSA